MDVTGNSTSIADGDTTPSTVYHSDFGRTDISWGVVDRSFTIDNSGSLTLTLGGMPIVSVPGSNAPDFTVIKHAYASPV